MSEILQSLHSVSVAGRNFFLLTLPFIPFNSSTPEYRLCPGMHSGISATWLIAAYMLSAFDLEKPTDPATGEIIEPSMEYHDSVV